MVQEHRGEYPSLWGAIESIAPKIGCVSQTLLEWVKRHEVDTGVYGGFWTASTAELLRLCARLSLRLTPAYIARNHRLR